MPGLAETAGNRLRYALAVATNEDGVLHHLPSIKFQLQRWS